jgi:hypothetical protein
LKSDLGSFFDEKNMKYEYKLTLEDKKVLLPTLRGSIIEQIDHLQDLRKKRDRYKDETHPIAWLQESILELMQYGMNTGKMKLNGLIRSYKDFGGVIPGTARKRLSKDYISAKELIDNIPCINVVRYYIEPSGVPNRFKCPWHEGKSASLVVKDKIWTCFGQCDETGQITNFVMKIENCSFKEALQIIKDKFYH